jgi:hypothetical protein
MNQILGLLFTVTLLAQTPDPKFPYLHFACGLPDGTSSVVDATGMAWQSDASILAPGGGSSSWTVTNAPAGVSPVYSHLRFGNTFAYTISVPDAGWYWLVLRLIEPSQVAIGGRAFAVTANGRPIQSDLDLAAVIGIGKPFNVYAPIEIYQGTLYLRFSTSVRSAVISGFELIPRDPLGFAPGSGLLLDRRTTPPTLSAMLSQISPPSVTYRATFAWIQQLAAWVAPAFFSTTPPNLPDLIQLHHNGALVTPVDIASITYSPPADAAPAGTQGALAVVPVSAWPATDSVTAVWVFPFQSLQFTPTTAPVQ